MTERIDRVATAHSHNQDAMQRQGFWASWRWQRSAQVHATLALVEQQRIANLIAVMAVALQGVGAGEHSKNEYVRLYQKINPQILEGLGL